MNLEEDPLRPPTECMFIKEKHNSLGEIAQEVALVSNFA